MEKFIVGTITVIVGIVVIIFREKFVDMVIKTNNEGLGFMHYGERERRIGLWQVPLFGILFIAFGILTMIGAFN